MVSDLSEYSREVQEIVGPFKSKTEAHAYARGLSMRGPGWTCKPKLMRSNWLSPADLAARPSTDEKGNADG